MSSDKRTILSGKRARSRRKKAALRAANRAAASPECDSEEDAKHTAANPRKESTASDKSTSHSEGEDDDGLVFVCRPTMTDFCSLFMPKSDAISRQPYDADCNTFTMRVPAFRETCEGFVTYTIELATCSEPRHTFQVERRFSEFVACAAELNQQLASGLCARYFAEQEDEESKSAVDGLEEEAFQWELPAKTWFRVTQPSALEERRVQLERSLENLLVHHDGRLCNLPVVRDFLMLDIFGVQVVEHKNLELLGA